MNPPDSVVKELVTCLENSLSPVMKVQKAAERQLMPETISDGYPMLLLLICSKDELPFHIRLQAAVTFKNLVKRHWKVVVGEDDDVQICNEDRDNIKNFIVDLMLKSPKQVQDVLSEAISYIGREDFPYNWPHLLENMVGKFESGDFNVINGILITAHSLFKRYRHECKSQELWQEIDFVRKIFAIPLNKLLEATMALREQHSSDKAAMQVIYSSLLLILKLFYSLSFQELIDEFEEAMETWVRNFLVLLTTDCPILNTEDEDEPGPVELVRGQICEILGLYASKYDDSEDYTFPKFVPDLIQAVWQLLSQTGLQKKYDYLVSFSLQFLGTVVERPAYKSLFMQEGVLKTICEKIVLPNMQLRELDIEDFNDMPESYIRCDLEGSDLETRRRGAADLVRNLCFSFESIVFEYFSAMVNFYLAEYSKDQLANWKQKDVVIYLCSSLAAKAQTKKHGITHTSSLVNVVDFFGTHILPELGSIKKGNLLILQADGLKYVACFRNQLPQDAILSTFPLLIPFIECKNQVVRTYAAYAIERLLLLRKPGQNVPVIGPEHIKAHEQQLLTSLFKALELDESPNEYTMKAIMRTFGVLKDRLADYLPHVMPALTRKLTEVSKNPTKPHFNHYLFESLCLAIRSSPQHISAFETLLLPTFGDILINDVSDFLPYVFQILSLMLERQTGAIPENYQMIFGHLLTPDLWSMHANIPALVRLFRAILEKSAKSLDDGKLNQVLGIWQRLIMSKSQDNYGFQLLETITTSLALEKLNQYLKAIFTSLFSRLSSLRTIKFTKGLIVFLSSFAIHHGASLLIQTIDGIQSKMFGRVIESIFCEDITKVSGATNRKIVAVGTTRILTCADLLKKYPDMWPKLLTALLGFFELPEDNTSDVEQIFELEEVPGFQGVYSRLAYAGDKENDPVGSIVSNPKKNLMEELSKMMASDPGKVRGMVNGVGPELQQCLQRYSSETGVTL